MKYEIHRCSVEHLKRKSRKHEDSDDDIDLQEMDLGDFKTVDSIGDVDGEEGITFQVRNELKFDDDILVESALDDDDFDSTAAVGQDFVNKVEVNYCSLCREYLSRSSKDDKIITDHCKSKKHLKWYYQSKKKDEKELSKAKLAAESSDVTKEVVTSTSAQDNDKSSKKSVPSEKDVKAVEENGKASKAEAEDSDLVALNEREEESTTPKKFKRLIKK